MCPSFSIARRHIFSLVCLLAFTIFLSGYNSFKRSDLSEREIFFKRLTVLTDSCLDAEAYFSYDGKKIVFQRACINRNIDCDKLFWMYLSNPEEVYPLNLKGRNTCAFFLPGDTLVVFASTLAFYDTCPPRFDWRKYGKYVWKLYPEFEIFIADLQGKILRRLTHNRVYDAEAVVSPDGKRILFTSLRDGDLEMYLMNTDGGSVKRLTYSLGYDGGGFFSPSGRWIVFRRSSLETQADTQEYLELLKQNLVAPTKMEIFIMDTNGRNLRQITRLGGANWAPYFHPSEEWIIFSSNWESYREGRFLPFHLYMVHISGEPVIRITYEGLFNAFPMFSHDGNYLIFSSTRGSPGMFPIKVVLAEWNEKEFRRYVLNYSR